MEEENEGTADEFICRYLREQPPKSSMGLSRSEFVAFCRWAEEQTETAHAETMRAEGSGILRD